MLVNVNHLKSPEKSLGARLHVLVQQIEAGIDGNTLWRICFWISINFIKTGAYISCHRRRFWSILNGIAIVVPSLTVFHHFFLLYPVQFQFKFQKLVLEKKSSRFCNDIRSISYLEFFIITRQQKSKHKKIEPHHQYQWCSTSVLVKRWIKCKKKSFGSLCIKLKEPNFSSNTRWGTSYHLPIMHLNDSIKWKLWIQRIKGQREVEINKKMWNSSFLLTFSHSQNEKCEWNASEWFLVLEWNSPFTSPMWTLLKYNKFQQLSV